MEEYEIPLSKEPLFTQIIATGIGVLLICALVTFFFNRALTVAPNLQGWLLNLLWLGLPGLWLVSSGIAFLTWPREKHILRRNTLAVHKKGWFGNSHEQLYRYDTILSVSCRTKAYGAYGIVTLSLAQQQGTIVIDGVKKPEEQAERIKEMIARNTMGRPPA